MNKNIIVFGGDGFCGFPTSLYLSKCGYDVTIVDNLVRRKTDLELECDSLTPISPVSVRLEAWQERTGKIIRFEHIDVADQYHRLITLLRELEPVAVVHFAEQRSAPYSMKSPYLKRYTVNNNINATHNILCAITEADIDTHVVHLGTMGVYGYSSVGLTIPEGYLDVYVDVNGEKKKLEILYPPSPGSVYHMTKTQDALMFYYYNKNDKTRITDLHQGIVWGTQTDETKLDDRLLNRYDYDGDYGTVLNRFLMQAVIGHPLTVHGVGGQTRAFIHIRDTVRCIKIAIENPSRKNERVKIFNQMTESHSVKELALKISELTGAQIKYYGNPRNEDSENELVVHNEKFLGLGLDPTTLDSGLLEEVMQIVHKYKNRCDTSKILCTSAWNKDIKIDMEGKLSL